MIRTIKSIDSKTATVEYESTTPKRAANEILWVSICSRLDFVEFDEAATKREQELIYNQMVKQARRIGKILGYELNLE